MATFNARTLRAHGEGLDTRSPLFLGKVQALQTVCAHKTLGIVALQETRWPATTRVTGTFYTMFFSAADSKGSYGCALWFAHSDASGHRLGTFPSTSLHCLIAEPRILAVDVAAPHCNAVVVCYHAPHSGTTSEAREAWWTDLTARLQRLASSRDIIFLGDANARVGSTLSQAVGPHDSQQENHAGALLHAAVSTLGLCIPSTLTDVCHSGSVRTWHDNYGGFHRLDYVSLPLAWKPQ
eukprot:5017916-Lingulodinium_polyedra.AAC.1